VSRYTHAHPLTKWAQGLLTDCSDDMDRERFAEFDDVLSRATEAAKDVEEDRDAAEEELARLRGVIEGMEARRLADLAAKDEAIGELLGYLELGENANAR